MSKPAGVPFRRGAAALTGILFGAALLLLAGSCNRNAAVQYRTMPIERGDLAVEVTASGILNPDTTVQVGTQVSGTIRKIFADFNFHVKKNQLIAMLDTTFLASDVEDAAASLAKAQAQEDLARVTNDREKILLAKGLAAQADVDQSISNYEVAKATTISARAALDQAKINLAYAYIRSPVTGVVVNRAVDVGQTVAASFSTPTLFAISNDLSKMQVQASVDEADIGQVKVGQQTHFTVDAYPSRTFDGVVSQIRLQPTTTENVVSYTVMVDVDNHDLALMPGMTANITIEIQSSSDVLKVPLAALKWVPPGAHGGRKNGHWGNRHGDSTAIAGHETGAKDSIRVAHHGSDTGMTYRHHHHGGGPDQARVPGAGERSDSSAHSRHWQGGDEAADSMTHGRIFVLENGKPVRKQVTIGLRNSGYVEIVGDVKEGDQVIVGILNQNTAPTPAAASPFGGGGMPRRF
jgi:HlyD family secretion protein